MLPKLILTDIDGVWTDGGMYYDDKGGEFKKFNTSDSAGILFCKLLGIKTGIITGEDTSIVQKRSNKLKIDYLFLGAKNKLSLITKLSVELGIGLDEIAYIGDDINDIPLLKNVGISAAPSNAPDYVKDIVNIKVPVEGGSGAFRWFVESILKEEKVLEKALKIYFKNLEDFNQ